MRTLVTTFLLLGFLAAGGQTALAQQSCRVCADQKKACMKNYAGPGLLDRTHHVHEIVPEVKEGCVFHFHSPVSFSGRQA
jgi:hypothetical protein